MSRLRPILGYATAALLVATLAGPRAIADSAQSPSRQDPSVYRSGVVIVHVTVTVTDADGRFVPDLTRDDFAVYEDGRRQPLTHFSGERVPVSLGLVLDGSGSMAGEKMDAARDALRRFVGDLLPPDDEVFLCRFNDAPLLVQTWTRNRKILRDRIDSVRPNGGTALFDAVAASAALVESGQHRKKALVIISDGHDTRSRARAADVLRQVRESEVLVYAVGIDADDPPPSRTRPDHFDPPTPVDPPFRVPPPGGGGRWPPGLPNPPSVRRVPPDRPVTLGTSRVNEAALRAMTDHSGGRTEIIWTAADLGPATASIADELTRQYFLAFQAPAPRDGRWHAITVEVSRPGCQVRARQGYLR